MNPLIFAGLPVLTQLEYVNKSAPTIVKIVCDYLMVNEQLVKSSSRVAILVKARYIISHFLKKKTSLTLKKIGEELGGRDHSTVINSLEAFSDRYQYERGFRIMADEIENKINELI